MENNEERNRSILTVIPDIIYVFDKHGTFLDYEDAEAILYSPMEDLKGKSLYDILPPEVASSFINLSIRAINTSEIQVYEYQIQSESLIKTFESRIKANDKGAVVAVIRDITSRKNIEEELNYQKHCFEALFKYSMDAIAFLDRQHNIIDVNSEFTILFNYTPEEIREKRLDDILAIEENREEAENITKTVFLGEPVAAEATRKSKDGRLIDVSIKGVPVLIDGEFVAAYGIYSDITERKRHHEKLKFLSMHDALTNLYNRAFFDESLQRLDTNRQLPISVVMADINGLKLVNDAFGHSVGDQLLVKTGEALKSVCRSEDIVCRLGGDEFAIIFPLTQEEVAEKICVRIKNACMRADDLPIPLSISLGVATKINIEENIHEIIKIAEERMYRNKLLDSKSSRSSIIASLQKTLREKTHETEEHSSRMQQLALLLGSAIGLSRSNMDELVLLAALHDLGKVAIPDHILLKSEGLTNEEWETIKKHPEIGHRIAKATPDLVPIAEKILAHHERWDGRGYPQGLREEEIPLIARIISIVDAFDVMTNGRPYKKALKPIEALQELRACAGTQFDPRLVEVFISLVMWDLIHEE